MRRFARAAVRALRHPLTLAEAVAQLSSVHVALRWVPLPTLLRWLAPPKAHRGGSALAVDAHYLWAINAAGRAMFGRGGCLRRALAVCWHCRRHNIAAELRIGVARSEHGIEAHAWVDHAGQILTGGPASYVGRFAPLGSPAQSALDLFELAR